MFAIANYDLGHTNVVKHELLNTEHTTRPIKLMPKGIPLYLSQEVEKLVDKMLMKT